MAAADCFYVTTPIYYVNDSPHIGHAYTTLACDALARFMRLDGRRVMFLTGTDEHGQKVEKAARDAGLDPQSFTDRVSGRFRDLAAAMAISNDDFIRTTEERHKRGVTALWEKLVASGEIYLGKYAGWYSVRDEAFYAEGELVDGKAPTGAPVEWVEEPSYFFRLSAWGDRLLAFYDANPDCILPLTRRNEVVSFVKGGLQDLSVSRTSFRWGIPVPGDPAHVMYVWLDALTNYMSAVGYPDIDERAASAASGRPTSMSVGKDILRFHAVYWPAFLMAAGIEPARKVFAHGWWTNEGQKISKSLGNVIDPLALLERYGRDATRYFLLREVAFGADGDFRHASHAAARQCRSRQRLRQSGAAGAVDDRPQLRGQGAGAGRARPLPTRRLLAAVGALVAEAARRDGDPGAAPGAGADLGGHRRGQPLGRRAGALDAAQDRPGADADGAVGAGRDHPPARHPDAAVHARCVGEAAGPAGGACRRARLRRAGQGRSSPAPPCRRRRASSRGWSRPS